MQTKIDVQRERALWDMGLTQVAGLDEVGRGCLAGPVLAAAVVIPPYCTLLDGVTDSKKLTARRREALYPLIRAQALSVAIGMASVAEIDQINILQATYLAMRRALKRLPAYDHVLIDGRRPSDPCGFGAYTAVIQGDQSSYAIACASIIAKVIRDRLMQRLALRYPGYGWEHNAGYATQAHRDALLRLGITSFHRRSFAPVRAAIVSM